MKRRVSSTIGRFVISAFIAAIFAAGCERRIESTSIEPPAKADAPLHSLKDSVTATQALASSSCPSCSPSAPARARVILREEVVSGKLWVTVYAHSVPVAGNSMQLWTYISEGMWAHRQREIRFSIKREPNEAETAFDRQLFELYKLIYLEASNAKLVDVYGRTELRGKGLLGRDDFLCILYGPPQSIAGIDAQAPFLSAVIVTCDEERLGTDAGYARVFARLGAEAQIFPAPFWTDRKRASVVRPGDREQSIFSKNRAMHVSGASVRLERKGGLENHSDKSVFMPGDRIVLSVLPRGVDQLKKLASAKETATALLLLLEMDPRAGTTLLWYPGQKILNATACLAADRERITANFIMIAGLPGEAQAGVVEDGFSMVFPEATWARVREAIAAGKPITIAGSGNVPEFVVEYVPAAYDNPIDGKRYESADGWAKYTPQGGVKKSTGPADMAGIVLLTEQNTIAERINIKDLTNLIDAIKTIVEAQVGNSKGPGSDIVIECEILPGRKKTFATVQRPALNRKLMEAIEEKLDNVAIPEVTGSVRFQVLFNLYGGLPSGHLTP